ncbi:MAG: hypothetical protein E6R05_02745 [Candidatus Moraniibacteriota bacterium]|nr:MAG: hypothetical protein E6R05_02745 [Candidatus Moranbacteria bacterium]
MNHETILGIACLMSTPFVYIAGGVLGHRLQANIGEGSRADAALDIQRLLGVIFVGSLFILSQINTEQTPFIKIASSALVLSFILGHTKTTYDLAKSKWQDDD